MTVHVLFTGTLFRAAEARTASSGRRYVKATLRSAAADNSTADFWDLITFSETAGTELSRLNDGERVAVQGALKLELYQPEGKPAKIQRTIFADSVLALRAPPKPKKSKVAPAGGAPPLEAVNIVPPSSPAPTFDDDIPF
jgi:single-stranded DNA-binding protein